ncbi:sn-glycerol-3-phosphate ABC transporter ATP-binding protein UgpC [Ferrovibrio sp.]|uniref:ABC transporter ATP-binding protein n=1 Tax=Ferrovibrio sp. TaxID=1917215 RepID=UPI0025BBF27A|nr:sn-glycerol-3-phosphate ABC transporter ATP-binding protein UgpC [Ferrovibrio sp.]MBX3456410.1 sn-glycerol-3-phosphate ABC transporter ATP-binding protein UgpC [Ferrovibrio sp.]
MASVSIRNLRKSLGRQQILHDISLEIEDGTFVVLVGPSGCGKSTLLRMIAGLEETREGEIHIGARLVNAVPPKERDIAMVFQSYALYPHMTVRENMGFSLKLAGARADAVQTAVKRAADILGLETLLDRRPRELSGGQRQRVAMGRAIVRDPEAFLFDEPLSNLDAKLRVKMRTEIKSLHQRLKTTMVYVTHDQIEAMTLADKIVVMREGRIEQTGAPLTLYDQPANMFVASFIGSPAMNFINGKVAIENDALMLVTAAGDNLRLSDTAVQRGEIGRPIIAGVRPEHLRIAEGGGLQTSVSVVEPTGSDTLLQCHSGDQDLLVSVNERIGCKPGERISLTADPAKIHLFDPQTERRIA